MGAFIVTLSLLLLFLVVESYLYSRTLRKTGLRITVTGTRGKTTLVRLLASVFREAGMSVLAKTTGSEARYIMPDGTEKVVPRRGVTSIMEQMRLIRLAAGLGVDCVITEIMSIEPENHDAETSRLIRPGITVLTNMRPDHLDSVDGSSESLSRLYLNDVAKGAKVYLPAGECTETFRRGVLKRGGRLEETVEGRAGMAGIDYSRAATPHRVNIDLVTALSSDLGIEVGNIARGLATARMDIGEPLVYTVDKEGKRVHFVNGFAANDPLSAMELVEKTIGSPGFKPSGVYGLMSLRSDRGDRTSQWIKWLREGGADSFSRLFVTGLHAAIVVRKVGNASEARWRGAEGLTDDIVSSVEDGSIVFGLVNIHGRGELLLRYWQEISAGKSLPEWCKRLEGI